MAISGSFIDIREVKYTTVTEALVSGTGAKVNESIAKYPTHHVAVTMTPGLTAGTIRIRARPVNATYYTKINLEAVNLGTATDLSWVILGFYEAWSIEVTGALSGGATPSVGMFVSSHGGSGLQ